MKSPRPLTHLTLDMFFNGLTSSCMCGALSSAHCKLYSPQRILAKNHSYHNIKWNHPPVSCFKRVRVDREDFKNFILLFFSPENPSLRLLNSYYDCSYYTGGMKYHTAVFSFNQRDMVMVTCLHANFDLQQTAGFH